MPPWRASQPLIVYNSLGKKKTQFIPLDPDGLKVTWYCCGPTVYDAGHLGHARNYVSTDILRRIMGYLGYNVEFVMNITDVDDKIILRARQQHLFDNYKHDHSDISADEVLKTAKEAYSAFARKNLPLLPEDLQPRDYDAAKKKAYGAVLDGGTLSGEGTPGDKEAKIKMYLNSMDSASHALNAVMKDPSSTSASEFFAAMCDILMPHLDSLYGPSIPSNDYSIFQRLTHHWECQFKKDLKQLNCLPPTRLTRVSEYINEIVKFIETIVEKGFAYSTSDGSVYFDIKSFEAAGHSYARLEPWNKTNQALQADGEGALSKRSSEKRSNADFALWKASKPGEPSWESPWGQGRPGWHIECSVMASAVLGRRIDIHSGGVDLAFPHHDNEIAQSEAYWARNSDQDGDSSGYRWINYFLHMGHLSIKGSKMSKSLKNFTTINDALQRGGGWTARGLRIVFLLGGYSQSIEITDDVVKAAQSWETTVNNFFRNTQAFMAEEEEVYRKGDVVPQVFGQPEEDLRTKLDTARVNFHNALLDSFNTPLAMSIIDDMIAETNKYIPPGKAPRNLSSVLEVARWVTQMVDIFGLDASISAADGGTKIGWSTSAVSDSNGSNKASGTNSNKEFIRGVSSYRDAIRGLALRAPPDLKRELLELSDTLRDVDFLNEGIDLADREPGQPALIKYVPREELIAARDQRQAELAAEAKRKEQLRLEKERLEAKRAQQASINHLEMFRTEEYSAWDEDGIPTKDAYGVDITKSRSKKLRKEWERQKVKHEQWLASGAQGVATAVFPYLDKM